MLESDVTSLLSKRDNIFISSKGTFICKGSLATFPADTIKNVLENLEGEPTNDIKPFVLFGMAFDSLNHNRKIFDELILPEEMIHIDDHNWVTHFRISSDSKPVPSNNSDVETIEHPHQIEMMSPESKDQFIDKVEIALKNIEIGNVSKIVIARQLNVIADVQIDSRLLVKELKDSQPESFIFSYGDFVGASPELLVEKFRDTVRCLPMAGTRKRHARRDDDDLDIADLQTNVKDNIEHRVVVEDIVNKLSSISKNVTSSKTPHVVRLPHVSHLATSISATANENTSLIDLVKGLHPTPAVAGTPTQKAIELIAQIEGFDRGLYGAPVGWINALGDGQCAIALRCARIEGNKAQLFAGVGIVEGSVAETEWNETQAKFGVIRDAMMNIAQ